MEELHGDDGAFAGVGREPRKKGWIWGVYLLLYVVAIPWYWPDGYRGPLVAGFPLWVVVTLGSALLLAGWTAWVIFHYWEED